MGFLWVGGWRTTRTRQHMTRTEPEPEQNTLFRPTFKESLKSYANANKTFNLASLKRCKNKKGSKDQGPKGASRDKDDLAKTTSGPV